MKNLLLIAFIFSGSLQLHAQNKIQWMSMNDALEAQKETPKKIFMDVYTDWCGPCKLLDKNTFGNKDVIKFVNENYYPVKFNAEGTEEIMYQDFNYTNPNYKEGRKGRNSQHLLAHALKITGYPTIVFFGESGDLIQPVVGYKTPAQLEIYLKMKNLLLIAFIFFGSLQLHAQDKIQWMSMNDALEAQKETPKKIFMDVYTDWCGPCKLLDKNTFGNKDVITFVNENYYPVKFNAEGTEEIMYQDFNYTNPNYQEGRKGRNSQHFLANALKISGYPTIVFFAENGDLIQPVVGYKTPKQLELYLKMIANDDYKKLTTSESWQEYQKNFKSTF